MCQGFGVEGSSRLGEGAWCTGLRKGLSSGAQEHLTEACEACGGVSHQGWKGEWLWARSLQPVFQTSADLEPMM